MVGLGFMALSMRIERKHGINAVSIKTQTVTFTEGYYKGKIGTLTGAYTLYCVLQKGFERGHDNFKKGLKRLKAKSNLAKEEPNLFDFIPKLFKYFF